MKVLFVGTELFPHVTVGGLADVLSGLPAALARAGVEVRMLLPGYPELLRVAAPLTPVASLGALMGGGNARLVRGRTPAGLEVYLLDQPSFFGTGGPYADRPDAPRRFAALSWAAAHLGRRGDGGWVPDILHAHDWPTGLAPAYLAFQPGPRPATLFTIHNLAYQGIFPAELLPRLHLPETRFTPDDLEYFGQLNFLKAGIRHADRITTVSPTYAREIQDASRGGLQGLLALQGESLVGILNGVDEAIWSPGASPHLAHPYDVDHLERRPLNKRALQAEMGLREDPRALLFGIVSRFAPQKGLDLVLDALPILEDLGAQLLVLGQGDGALEAAYRAEALRRPGRMSVRVGFDTGLSHRCFAGTDVLLVPSREEPCGLTQLYAQAFGSLPLARRTGGLADTVVDATPEALRARRASGFLFEEVSAEALASAMARAHTLFRQAPEAWQLLQRTAMGLDRSWSRAAQSYLALYQELGAHPAAVAAAEPAP
ncbi:MAG TPA: glycogen synthase GlgA [Holophagaceae bacterium]